MKFKRFLNEENTNNKVYCVEIKTTWASVNNKPLWNYDFAFTSSKKEALEIRKKYKKENIQNGKRFISIFSVTADNFSSINIWKRKVTAQGETYELYSIDGIFNNRFNKTNGKALSFSTGILDLEDGGKIKNFLDPDNKGF